MATIGHTLIGLSLSETCPANARTGRMPYIWVGVVVFSAHVVDLVEWLALFVAPPHWDKHFLTQSPWMALGVAGAICVAVAATTRCRKPWPYLVITLAVLSHLLLDHHPIRALVANAYGLSADLRLPDYPEAIAAELWLYGLVFVVTTLLVSWRRREFKPKTRKLSLVLAVMCLLAAAARSPWIWAPVYMLSLLHCALMWSRRMDRRYLWSLVPLLPIAVPPAFDLYAMRLTDEATRLREAKLFDAAIALNQRILRMPARKSFVANYLELARSYQSTGAFDLAEKAYLDAREESHIYGTFMADFFLAKFYTDDRVKGTPYFQPRKAVKLLDEIIRLSPYPDHQRWASELRTQLRQKGLIDPEPAELSPPRFSVP